MLAVKDGMPGDGDLRCKGSQVAGFYRGMIVRPMKLQAQIGKELVGVFGLELLHWQMQK